MKQEFNVENTARCPRCDGPKLKPWTDLTLEEQEVVKRLPESAKSNLRQRMKTHRWCTRCWFEETEVGQHNV